MSKGKYSDDCFRNIQTKSRVKSVCYILLVLMVGHFGNELLILKEEPKKAILVVSNNQETVTMLKEVGKVPI